MRGFSSQGSHKFKVLFPQASGSWSRFGLVCALALLASGIGCSHAKSEPLKTQVVETDSSVIQIEAPERFTIAEATTRSVFDEIRVNGTVSPDVSRTVPVLSLSGGRVVDIRTRLGDDVKKGQVLVRISSPDVSAAFSDLQKFEVDEVLARKQLQRSQLLYDRGAIAQRDLEMAEDVENKAEVDLKTALDHIHILGGDPKHPSPILNVVAPISGTIVEQNVASGTGVRSLDNSPNLFTIADLSRVWVLCDVYEDVLAKVHQGDIAVIRANAFPDRVFHGRVSNISRVLDPNTRSAKVRIEIDNPGRILRAGMFVTASFKSTQPVTRVVIPASAAVRLHDKDWVFLPVGGNQFRRQEVQLGAVLPDGHQEVITGLTPSSKVVEKALQFSSAGESQ
jgi:cobalt-zinc-cadmium efflux system membrane fusion protein